MDDPWAAPAWSTPAKPSASSSKPFSLSPPRSPPSSFDVADPWSVPASAAHSSTSPKYAGRVLPEADTPNRDSELSPTQTPGWGDDTHSGWAQDNISPPEPPDLDLKMSSPVRSSPRKSHEDAGSSWGGVAIDHATLASDDHATFAAPGLTTPPRPSSALQDITSPSSVLSYNSPHSRRSMTPHVPDLAAEDDPEAAFAAALPGASRLNDMPKFNIPMPKSPSFGDGEFGGFAIGTGDESWGGKASWGGAAEISQANAEGHLATVASGGEEEEGWGGGSRVVSGGAVKQAPEDMDWQHAQERIRLQQQLAPQDKVERLRSGWKEVAQGVIGLKRIAEPTPEQLDAFDSSWHRLQNYRDEALQSLSTVPSNINTYPPVLSSFTTHSTYQSSLTRPNPSPGTSLLTAPPRRTTWQGKTGESSSTPWLSRSRLGEPEITSVEAAPQETEQRSRWAFWGRKATADKPLVTSGGGVLEVKTLSPATNQPQSQPSSAVSGRLSGDRPPSAASNKPSRPESPASFAPAFTQLPETTLHDPVDLTSPSPASMTRAASASMNQPAESPSGTAPSAVSRFFGRIRRQPSSSMSTTMFDADADGELDDPKDFKLGDDDFSFLNQVPSAAPASRAQGDLLGMESGRGEDIAGLESMLASRPVPLPAPLAPPPRNLTPTYIQANGSRSVSAVKRASDMDLLSDLFGGDADSASITSPIQQASTPGTASTSQAADPIGWSAFLEPTNSKTSQSAATSSKPPALSFPPPPIPPPADFARPASSANAAPRQPLPPKIPSNNDGFGDFDDFGTPQKASTAQFPNFTSGEDDFDDFTSFNSTPFQAVPKPVAQASIVTPKPMHPPFPAASFGKIAGPEAWVQTTPIRQPQSSLDHTPTINLLNDVNGMRGKRWPAPPSPDVPSLSPPPALAPPAAAPLLPSPSQGSAAKGGGGGLSAQDLSFFDNL